MLRTLRVGWAALNLSRLPLRTNTEATKNGIQIQRVRLSKPFVRPRAILTGAVTIVICYGLFSSVVLSPLIKIGEELDKDLNEEERRELDKQGESVFIPFPGTTKMVQPPPYNYNDPEWGEFVKISKDETLQKSLRVQLIKAVREICEQSPEFVRVCGKRINARRYWLDLEFPARPPPEFERSGPSIEIAEDYIAWTTMPVDSHTVFRIRQALWPSAVTQSLWSFHKVLLLNELRKAAGILGIQTKPDKSIEARIAELNQRQAALAKRVTLSKDGVSHPHSGDLREPEHSNTNDTAPMASPPSRIPAEASKGRAQPVNDKPHLTPRDSTSLRALVAFRTRFAQTWRPAESYPPRGSVYLAGLIEIETPTVLALLEIKQAAWDPQTKTWHRRSIRPVLRRVTRKQQRPLGPS